MSQLDLFEEPVVEKPVKVTIDQDYCDDIEPEYPIDLCLTHEALEKQINKDNFSTDSIIDYLSNKANLWDLRCWNELKDLDEIRHKILAIVEVHNPFSVLNDGHAAFWIRVYLKRKNSSLEAYREVMGCFVNNEHISYRNRITPCMLDNLKCPHFVKHLNTAHCPCSECNDQII